MNEEIKETIEELKVKIAVTTNELVASRNNYDELKPRYDEFKKQLEKDIEKLTAEKNAEDKEFLDAYNAEYLNKVNLENKLRQVSIRMYEMTNEKKVATGLGVRVTLEPSYESAPAVEWAKVNSPIMIVTDVDKKAFETYIKSLLKPNAEKYEKGELTTVKELPFVTITPKKTCSIATSLQEVEE